MKRKIKELMHGLDSIRAGQVVEREIHTTQAFRILVETIGILDDTLENFNKESRKYSESLIKLTKWLIFLTLALVLIALVQLFLIFK